MDKINLKIGYDGISADAAGIFAISALTIIFLWLGYLGLQAYRARLERAQPSKTFLRPVFGYLRRWIEKRRTKRFSGTGGGHETSELPSPANPINRVNRLGSKEVT
jgi:hypothetical protein